MHWNWLLCHRKKRENWNSVFFFIFLSFLTRSTRKSWNIKHFCTIFDDFSGRNQDKLCKSTKRKTGWKNAYEKPMQIKSFFFHRIENKEHNEIWKNLIISIHCNGALNVATRIPMLTCSQNHKHYTYNQSQSESNLVLFEFPKKRHPHQSHHKFVFAFTIDIHLSVGILCGFFVRSSFWYVLSLLYRRELFIWFNEPK